MKNNHWALILGGSSGLGLATAKKLASHGYNLIIIHRDRKLDLEEINRSFNEIRKTGVTLISYNKDAVNLKVRENLLSLISAVLPKEAKIKVLVHSIAKGSLKPMNSKESLTNEDFQTSIQAMALSLYDWTKALHTNDLFDTDTRIISFTSEGSSKAWKHYGAVSIAKASLEALTRSIALEFASCGIKANCIQAGVTETKSFNLIPGYEEIKEFSLKKNPFGRLTTPQDVANAVYLLTTPEAKWINGTIIKVDGGESLQ
ncbi:SDR family NAD(P)-dependent oxidoreductase [Ascidiimonas sp. W6]|uniref:SDR family NAD(P)-dependent oxidoreductase n=1 Tax=Ascidiimonas meishanensis TaxID=3128903 RepID=UPI0030EF7A9D